jgi:hypothetical protein
MAAGGDPYEPADAAAPKLSVWHRFLLVLPRFKQDRQKVRLQDRLRSAVLKPEDPDAAPRSRGAYELEGEELVNEEKRTNDKERAIGLLAGPVATIIAFLVIHDLVVNDPPARLSDGAINKLHVNLSTYSDLFIVLIVLSFGITAMALWRKRLYLGMVTALYGLAIFNLHYWGFGVPFVMVGAWYLVRAYRLHRNLREATAEGSSLSSRPTTSKRYTPPSLSQKQLPSSKSRPKRRAG